MKLSLVVAYLCCGILLLAQQPGKKGPPPTPKNLKILSPGPGLMIAMRSFNEALGVDCAFCHVQGDMASDANPNKETARKMIGMVRQIGTHFASTTESYPAGYSEVDCMTCHRGSSKVETKGTVHFLNRQDAEGFNPPKEKAVNLKVLAPDTEVHGAGSIMEQFRDALLVDCAYCHSGGGENWAQDKNPRKEMARNMIVLTREINANFPGTGVYPAGAQMVSCYTCHRGDPHPLSEGNKNYPPVAK